MGSIGIDQEFDFDFDFAPALDSAPTLYSFLDSDSEIQERNIPEKATRNEFEVDWKGDDDPRNPLTWSSKKKWLNLALLSSLTFVTPLASSMFAPGVASVLKEFHNDSTLLASFVVSVYLLGYSFGPLLCAPLSEMYGRLPVYQITSLLFVVFTIACAVAPTLNTLISFRFFAGSAGSAPLVLGGGSVADLYNREERGAKMAIFAMGPLLGPVLGPVIGAFMSESKGWRWVFWFITIVSGFITILLFIFMRETYAPVLLEREAAKLRKSTGNKAYRSKMASDDSPRTLLKKAFIRPTKMLVTSPTVVIFVIYISIIYGYLYLLFTTITEVYEEVYRFSTGLAGLSYIGLGVGMFIGLIAFGTTSDRRIKGLIAKGKEVSPEVRLEALVPAAICIPIGLFWYGWSAEKHIHWIMPIIGTCWVGLGLIGIFMGIQTYLVDCFTLYAASVTAAVTIGRSLVGALLPLAGQPLYENLGLGWGNSLLAFLALAMVPLPLVFLKIDSGDERGDQEELDAEKKLSVRDCPQRKRPPRPDEVAQQQSLNINIIHSHDAHHTDPKFAPGQNGDKPNSHDQEHRKPAVRGNEDNHTAHNDTTNINVKNPPCQHGSLPSYSAAEVLLSFHNTYSNNHEENNTMASNGEASNMLPRDLSHHFSKASKKRVPNVMKEYYRFLRIPGMGSFAGGSPYPGYFPFDDLELSLVSPETLCSEKIQPPNGVAEDNARRNKLRITRSVDATHVSQQIDLDTALQYGLSSGYPPLYAWIKKLVTTVYYPSIPYQGGPNIIITGGSADGLAKIYDVFFNHWDEDVHKIEDREGLLVEEYVYPPAIAQVRSRDVNIVPIKMDAEGMLVEGVGGLLDVLGNWDVTRGKRPHMLYSVPTGQNPTSGVLSASRRKQIYLACSEFDVLIIEDDPYWTLSYPSAHLLSAKYRHETTQNGPPSNPSDDDIPQRRTKGYKFLDELVPSFLEIDADGRVIRIDTFSKIIAPGCRLGYITAQPDIIEQLFRATDATTQPPSGFVQSIVAKLISSLDHSPHIADNPSPSPNTNNNGGLTWGFDGWIRWCEGLRNNYQRRMVTMASVFEASRFITMPNHKQTDLFEFTWPRGGMFIWLKVNIFTHPLASSSSCNSSNSNDIIDPQRLMLALWIFCTQEPYRIIMNPGKDFAANDRIRDQSAYLYLRFCFAAVDENILVPKAKAFTTACHDFWGLTKVEDVDRILREEDLLVGDGKGGEAGEEKGERMGEVEDW